MVPRKILILAFKVFHLIATKLTKNTRKSCHFSNYKSIFKKLTKNSLKILFVKKIYLLILLLLYKL